MAIAPAPLRSEIWLVNFDPAVGAEIRKLRPALIVNDNGIGRLALRIVVPITDWKPGYSTYPWFVLIPADAANSLAKDSGADAFQVKSVSLDRFDRRLGVVTEVQVDAVAKAVAVCVGLP
jgi:mRNA interferase MazF